MILRRSRKREAERTTIGLKRTTKDRLDNSKSPGQSYDGFIRQLIAFWDRMDTENTRGSQSQ
jgi:hypothetical protein